MTKMIWSPEPYLGILLWQISSISHHSRLQDEELMLYVIYRSKTRGLGAGRKLKNHRRAQLWADKDYKKSHLGNEWKKPFAGASHAKGIVLEKM